MSAGTDQTQPAGGVDPEPQRRGGARTWASLVSVAIVAAAVVWLFVGGHSSPPRSHPGPASHAAAGTRPGRATVDQAAAIRGKHFAGQVLRPLHPAPDTTLRNYLGNPVNLSQFRGKALLVTFLYVHCTDECPLIASQLHQTLTMMPKATRDKLRIVAISVDPKGDNRATVTHFLKVHQMTGRMDYLLGSQAQLSPVWKKWSVAAEAEPGHPDAVMHSTMVYGVDATGEIITIYPSTFTPKEILHDVPLLASA